MQFLADLSRFLQTGNTTWERSLDVEERSKGASSRGVAALARGQRWSCVLLRRVKAWKQRPESTGGVLLNGQLRQVKAWEQQFVSKQVDQKCSLERAQRPVTPSQLQLTHCSLPLEQSRGSVKSGERTSGRQRRFEFLSAPVRPLSLRFVELSFCNDYMSDSLFFVCSSSGQRSDVPHIEEETTQHFGLSDSSIFFGICSDIQAVTGEGTFSRTQRACWTMAWSSTGWASAVIQAAS